MIKRHVSGGSSFTGVGEKARMEYIKQQYDNEKQRNMFLQEKIKAAENKYKTDLGIMQQEVARLKQISDSLEQEKQIL